MREIREPKIKKKQKSHSSNGEIYTKNVHNAIYLNIQIGNGKNWAESSTEYKK